MAGWSAMADAVGGLARECWPWAAFFHACYWACRLAAPRLFETYEGIERDKRGYWCASMVSSFHAVLITALSVQAMASDPALLSGADFFHSNPLSRRACRVFLGYIFSDLLLSLYYRARWAGWVENLVHHVCIMATWGIFITTGSGQFFACIAQICELTTPFINQRWFLYEAGLKSGKVYLYNGLAIVLLWFITRIIFYSVCGVKMVLSFGDMARLGYLRAGTIMFCYTAGLLLQYFWFFKIMRGALKNLKSRPKTDTDNKKKA